MKALKLHSQSCREDARQAIIFRLTGHKNIIKLKEILQDARGLYIIMELAEGGDLFDRIEAKLIQTREGFSEEELRNAVASIARALVHLHRRDIVHLDLKPENIIYNRKGPDGDLKLCDFGFATIVKEEEALRLARGTPQYVAPEVLLSKQRRDGTHEGGLGEHGYGTQADLWSLGVILFILVSGCFPFDSSNRNPAARQREILQKIKEYRDGNVRFPERGFIYPGARDLILKLLKRDPSERLTAKQVLQDEWIVNGGAQPISREDSQNLTFNLNFEDFNRARRKMLNPTMRTIIHKLDKGFIDEAAFSAANVALNEGLEEEEYEFEKELITMETGVQALITTIFSAVETQNPTTEQTCAEELRDFTMRSRARQERLLEAGGMKAIIALVRKANSIDAKRFAIIALTDFLSLPTDEDARPPSPAPPAGARGLRASMNAAPADFLFHESVCRAAIDQKGIDVLASLLLSSYKINSNRSAEHFSGEARPAKNARMDGGLPCAEIKPGNVLLVRQAMRTLAVFARHPVCHADLIRLSVVEPLVQFCCEKDTSESLRHDIALGLSILADEVGGIRLLVEKANDLIQAALNVVQSAPAGVEAACNMCKRLAMLFAEVSTRSRARRNLLEAGGMDIVRALLEIPDKVCNRYALVTLCHIISELFLLQAQGVHVSVPQDSWFEAALVVDRDGDDSALNFLRRWLRFEVGYDEDDVGVVAIKPDRSDRICIKPIPSTLEVRNDSFICSTIHLGLAIPAHMQVGLRYGYSIRLNEGCFCGWAREDYLLEHQIEYEQIDADLESEIMNRKSDHLGQSSRTWALSMKDRKVYTGGKSSYCDIRCGTGDVLSSTVEVVGVAPASDGCEHAGFVLKISYQANGKEVVAFNEVFLPDGCTVCPAVSLAKDEQVQFLVDQASTPAGCSALILSQE
uniref:Protein kinase domain-containing protein n=1 Tax=Palpitomonas bilix TaxID=652834 RepID=A0A7S3DLU1_9EUKA